MHACSKTKYLFPYAGEVSVHEPITQFQFVGALRINFRVESLLQNSTEEQPESLRTGRRDTAMAIVNKNKGAPVPFHIVE
ncbi:midA, putative [Medicago truncatula]|uniref:MidA, putative n=1 Tax=Medicago truncatula TaxID=3880 RepID=G7K5U9_MEDTR|nr:midA, putative [Medicago truncatula]